VNFYRLRRGRRLAGGIQLPKPDNARPKERNEVMDASTQQRSQSLGTRRCAKPARLFILIGLTRVTLFFSANLTFAQQSKGWNGRFWVGATGRYVLSDNDTFEDPTFGTIETSVSGSAFTLGGDVEYMFTKWLGLDFALAYTDLPVEFQHFGG